MSLSRIFVGAAAAAFISAAMPLAAQAQSGGWKTSCNDGSATMATGANACDGHGGIHRVHTAIQHRTPTKTNPAPVTQAGTSKSSTQPKPHYEERRGWRWGRHHEERKREERREERREAKHRIVRCRDGRNEKVVGERHDVCKHHGGIAH